jgi:hypothetical protein
MKKTILTVVAFLVLFGFAVSGAMAQATWTWADPVNFSHTGTGKLTELASDPTNDLLLYGIDDGTGGAVIVTLGLTVTGVPIVAGLDPTVRDLAVGFQGGVYVITDTAVAIWATSTYTPLPIQPRVPTATTGTYKHIAAGKNGKLFVLYETATEAQYISVGNPPVAAIPADVKITPQSLNLGSNGNWVTCRIGLPAGYSVADIDLDSICITAIDGDDTFSPICRASGSPSSVGRTLMVKFSRGELADAITAVSPGASSVTITVTGSGGAGEGAFVFTGDDTIKTKPAKTKKPK